MEMIKRDNKHKTIRKSSHTKNIHTKQFVMITARELCFLGPYCGRSVMNEFARESIGEAM